MMAEGQEEWKEEDGRQKLTRTGTEENRRKGG